MPALLRLSVATFAAFLTAVLCNQTATAGDSPPRLALPDPPYEYVTGAAGSVADEDLRLNFDNSPKDNPLTDSGVTLGRALFYDTRLSANNTVSCGSCHQQRHAFSDPRRYSPGFEGHQSDRNSMSLVNLRHSRAGFFWDERASTVEQAVTLPIHNRIEMGQDVGQLVDNLSRDERYLELFARAFGDPGVTEQRVAKALAQFVRALASYDSRFDRAAADAESFDEPFDSFSAAENLGKRVFAKNCKNCHTLATRGKTTLFAMFRSLNNGVDGSPAAHDGGRGDITFNPSEVGLFKASSLRNVQHTAPYMHDGRFPTLEDVIEHYSTGVKRHPTVGPARRLQLSQQEKAGLLAFLKTLTDEGFLADPRFSDPWLRKAAPAEREQTANAAASPAQASQAYTPGMTPKETSEWMQLFDANNDGSLGEQEQFQAAQALHALGVTRIRTRSLHAEADAEERTTPRSRGPSRRGPGGETGDGAPPRLGPLVSLVRLGDGGRGEVRYDRALSRLGLNAQQGAQARGLLRETKRKLEGQTRRLDQRLLKSLRAELNLTDYARFQELVASRRLDRNRIARRLTVENIVEEIAAFDQNSDGELQAKEVAQLAKSLASTPGGLGAETLLPDMQQFHSRLMAYDQDSDKTLTAAELPDRLGHVAALGDADGDQRITAEELTNHIRQTAFNQLVSEGIYVGGGFGNTLDLAKPLLEEIGLPDERLRAAIGLFDEHKRQVDLATEAAVDQATKAFAPLLASRGEASRGEASRREASRRETSRREAGR